MKNLTTLLPKTLVSKSLELIKLNELISFCLDDKAKMHLYIVEYQDEILTIISDSPAWRTRILYRQAHIMKTFKHHGLIVSKIIIKIGKLYHHKPSISNTRDYSPPAANIKQLILSHAEHIKDPALQNSLKKLANLS